MESPDNLGSEALEWFPDSRSFSHSNFGDLWGTLRLGGFVSHLGLIVLGVSGGTLVLKAPRCGCREASVLPGDLPMLCEPPK